MQLFLVYEAYYDHYEVLYIETNLETAMEKAKSIETSNYTIGIELWEDDGCGSFRRVKEIWDNKGA